MSDTTTIETPEVEIVEQETAKVFALKRFAKAFAAKARKAASAIKAAVVRNVGDNETPVSTDEGAVRKTLRYVTAVPKWIGHGVVFVARAVVWTLSLVISIAMLFALVIVAIPVIVISFAVMIAFKVIQGIALLLRTPYLIVRGDDCLKTDYVGYVSLWRPKYFAYTRISQVFLAQELNAKEAADDVIVESFATMAAAEVVLGEPTVTFESAPLTVLQGGKGRPTSKQRKRRPARIPAVALAGAEV